MKHGNDPKIVVLHCSATPDSTESKFSVEDVRRWHIEERGWKDIGYHYYITRDGEVAKGRKDSEIGAHVKGHNRGSLGVCYEGTHFPTVAQLDSIMNLYRVLNSMYGITHDKWFGHYEFNPKKECPGFEMDYLRNILSKLPIVNS